MAASLNPFDDPPAEDKVNYNPFDDEESDGFNNARIVMDEAEFPASFHKEGISLEPEVSESGDIATMDNAYDRVSHRVSAESVIIDTPRREEDPLQRRRQIPVYTLGWTSTPSSHFTPVTGLDFLAGVEEVLLQQTATNWSNPNTAAKRYIVKVPQGETLYASSENSTELERRCCGSQRSFQMSVMDPTQQEAASFVRRLATTLSCLPGLRQELQVFTPGNIIIGKVKQDWAWNAISFTVVDANGEDVYRIFGPNTCVWTVPIDATFVVASGTGGGRLSIISRKWNNQLGDYNIHVKFPAPGTNQKHKMLLLGAVFLIEYMFFEHRSTSCLRIC